MKLNAIQALLPLFLALSAGASPIEAPVSGELSPSGPSGSIGTSLGAPIPLQMNVPVLSGTLAPAFIPAFSPAPLVQPSALVVNALKTPAAAVPVEARSVSSPEVARSLNKLALSESVKSAPSIGDKTPEAGYEEGRVRFDQAALISGGISAPSAGASWSNVKSTLLLKAPAGGGAKTPAAVVARTSRERLSDAAELGLFAGAWQILAGLLFLIAGAHAAYPVLAGALWALGGAELIKHQGSLRSVVVGGWQSSHDQKMRVDYGTGKLKDIRGRKYGEDRYDITLPGPVSAREQAVIDGAAVLSGLPWFIGASPSSVLLYLMSAAAVLYLRRLRQRGRPQPKTATAEDAVFERER